MIAWQDAYITDTNGNILQTIFHQASNAECWVHQTVDLAPWVGQTIRRQVPGASGWLRRPHQHVCGRCRCSRSGAMRFHAYANAQSHGDAKVAPDAASASISYSVRTVRFGELASERREFPASLRCERVRRLKGRFRR